MGTPFSFRCSRSWQNRTTRSRPSLRRHRTKWPPARTPGTAAHACLVVSGCSGEGPPPHSSNRRTRDNTAGNRRWRRRRQRARTRSAVSRMAAACLVCTAYGLVKAPVFGVHPKLGKGLSPGGGRHGKQACVHCGQVGGAGQEGRGQVGAGWRGRWSGGPEGGGGPWPAGQSRGHGQPHRANNPAVAARCC